ncbi:hypothetical protein OHU17_36815 (plasmid) [Streptomyces goshikiensis]|uniref:Uncharacterized protein n=1 Tax=Streptomyces goshikiensis TaxID=1942 RepID=A0ABZ1RXQ9_9ACTN|nr:hypothetical protein [Streptomyces goshikiensis]
MNGPARDRVRSAPVLTVPRGNHASQDCRGGTGSYYAWAICQNNKYVSGPVRSGGVWSYAYCSNVGSTLRSGGSPRLTPPGRARRAV